jgi:hypothetical protein
MWITDKAHDAGWCVTDTPDAAGRTAFIPPEANRKERHPIETLSAKSRKFVLLPHETIQSCGCCGAFYPVAAIIVRNGRHVSIARSCRQ